MATKVIARIDRKILNNVAKKLEQISDPLKPSDARELGKIVVAEMKDLISKGISPLSGKGRFPAYKNSKTGYPSTVRSGDHPEKRNTPVNLKLTGKFLKALTSKPKTIGNKHRTEVGYFDDAQGEKEKGHREMANGQLSRPTIPNGSEQFAQRIQVLILAFTSKVLDRIIKS